MTDESRFIDRNKEQINLLENAIKKQQERGTINKLPAQEESQNIAPEKIVPPLHQEELKKEEPLSIDRNKEQIKLLEKAIKKQEERDKTVV